MLAGHAEPWVLNIVARVFKGLLVLQAVAQLKYFFGTFQIGRLLGGTTKSKESG